MKVREYAADEVIVEKGETLEEVYIIIRGMVSLKTDHEEFLIESGGVLGLSEQKETNTTITAKYNSVVAVYDYHSSEDLLAIFHEQPKYSYAFLHASLVECMQIMEVYASYYHKMSHIVKETRTMYDNYILTCEQEGLEEKEYRAISTIEDFSLKENIEDWELDYFLGLNKKSPAELKNFYFGNPDLCAGVILQINRLSYRMIANLDGLHEFIDNMKPILMNEDDDLLELWFDATIQLACANKSYLLAQVRVNEWKETLKKTGLYSPAEVEARFMSYASTDFENYALLHAEEETSSQGEMDTVKKMSKEEILSTDFTTHIMEFAEYEKEEIAQMKQTLKEYKAVASKTDSDDNAKLRKIINSKFYEIYDKAIFKAVKENGVTSVLELFFQFGILDLDIAGKEVVGQIVDLVETIDFAASKNVFTMYQWLRMVYRGEKEPSKSDLDLDYHGDLLEQRKNHMITKEQEQELKKDQTRKLKYELENFFRSTNRGTHGRPSTFCAIPKEEDFIRGAEQMILSPEKLMDVLMKLKSLDFTCFYREVLFSDTQHGINQTQIKKEVLPDIILMPNVGAKAMMWQETSGAKKDTPARFVFPIFTAEDYETMMLENFARYRWEICRRIMGVRWNDIREKSLTSEFYDYIQFYRKNRDLSQQAKDKVKSELVHARNNYREVFVQEYINWMKYEANGSMRLNKVSRKMLLEYIPFPKETRRKLSDNPMFKELFDKYDIITARKFEKEKTLFNRYQSEGGEMTEELKAHLALFEM